LCSSCDGEKREKIKQKWIEKYGFDNPSKSKEIKNKISKKNKENYKKNKEKIKKNNLEKYGVEFLFKNEKFQNEIKKIMIDKYGVDNIFKLKKIQDKIKKNHLNNRFEKSKIFYKKNYNLNILNIDYEKRIYKIKCNRCKKTYEISQSLLNNRLMSKTIICLNCNPINSSKSGFEIELYNFLKDNYNEKIIRNKRKFLNNKFELDFYLPNLKVAFEFNGLWWHSLKNKDKNYHKNKSDLAFKNKINLIYIWEDDWIFNKEKVKLNILNILNILNNINYKYPKKEYLVERNSFEEYFLMKNNFKVKEKLKPKLCLKTNLSNKIFNIYNSGNIILYK